MGVETPGDCIRQTVSSPMLAKTLKWVNFNSCVQKKIHIKLLSQLNDQFKQTVFIMISVKFQCSQ